MVTSDCHLCVLSQGVIFLVFWPDEDRYSEVPESKIVGDPGSPGETIQAKERAKVSAGRYTGISKYLYIYSGTGYSIFVNLQHRFIEIPGIQ